MCNKLTHRFSTVPENKSVKTWTWPFIPIYCLDCEQISIPEIYQQAIKNTSVFRSMRPCRLVYIRQCFRRRLLVPISCMKELCEDRSRRVITSWKNFYQTACDLFEYKDHSLMWRDLVQFDTYVVSDEPAPSVLSVELWKKKYSVVRYNEGMLQRTVFINKIRMLQRTQMLTTNADEYYRPT
jgi:hypothetical protein